MMSNPGPELFKAIAAFQATKPKAAMDGNNPHFRSRYATLESVTDTARQATKHGLSAIQLVNGDEVITMLCHESGEYVQSCTKVMASKQNAHGYGSGITYARRYGLAAILGIVNDPDDDGNAAVSSPPEIEVPFDDGVQEPTGTPEEQRKAKHHPSWQENRGRFCAILTMELDINYNELAGFLEAKGMPRPSGMNEGQRRKVLDKLRTEAGRNGFNQWKKEQ
jgi:hypothetical protein|tara:strand:+ start:991 stop:1656 length:666 start_codon:yes stop_codon:yes gene_type:complete